MEGNSKPIYSINMEKELNMDPELLVKTKYCYQIFSDPSLKDRCIRLFSCLLNTVRHALVFYIRDEDLSDEEIVIYVNLYGLYFDGEYADIIKVIINDLLNYLDDIYLDNIYRNATEQVEAEQSSKKKRRTKR